MSPVANDVDTGTVCFYAGITKSMNLTLRVSEFLRLNPNLEELRLNYRACHKNIVERIA